MIATILSTTVTYTALSLAGYENIDKVPILEVLADSSSVQV